MSGIKASKPLPTGRIQNTTRLTTKDAFVTFSFKHLDLNSNPKFCLKQCEDGYLEKLLTRLRDVSAVPFNDFITSRSPALRSHSITWQETSEPNGFIHLNEQLRGEQPWQFQITKSVHGRVHGILLDEVFYVVWLDPKHELYPWERR